MDLSFYERRQERGSGSRKMMSAGQSTGKDRTAGDQLTVRVPTATNSRRRGGTTRSHKILAFRLQQPRTRTILLLLLGPAAKFYFC